MVNILNDTGMPDSSNVNTSAPQDAPKPVKSPSLDMMWEDWNRSKDPAQLQAMLQKAQPVIDKSLVSYAPNSSPAVRSKAKVLALKAIKSYKPGHNTKLNTWLHTQMRPLMRESLSYDTVHTPEKIRFDLSRLNKMHNRFVDEHRREPNDDELADYSGLSVKRIRHIRNHDRGMLYESFFDPEEEEDSGALPQTQQAVNLWEDFVYSELGETDKLIYDLKTGRSGRDRPLSVNQISKKVGISASAVSQRLSKISKRIQEGAELDGAL